MQFNQDAESLGCDETDPGLLQTSGFSTNGHCKYSSSTVSGALWVYLYIVQFELVCDDANNTVLMMPPLLVSHQCLEEEEMRNLAEMASLDNRDDD